MSHQRFKDVFSSFLEQADQYDSAQQKELLKKTKKALIQVLNSMPNPKPKKDIEMFIADILDQKGLLDDKLFSQFDPQQTGKILPENFLNAIQPIGITLKDVELDALLKKFPGTERDGHISYVDFLQYVKIKQLFSSSKKSSQQSTGTNQTDIRKVKLKTLQQEVFEGLQQYIDNLHTRSSKLIDIFQMLDTGGNLISISSLIKEIMKTGFPKNGVAAPDVELVARDFSKKTTGMLTYKEFTNFFKGQTPRMEIQEQLKKFNQRDLQQVLIKISNQAHHKVFQEMDTDRDGLVSTDDLVRGLMSLGLSKSTAHNQDFREYVETFTKRRKGFFKMVEFSRFVSCRGGNPYKHEVVNVPTDYSTAEIILLLGKNTDLTLTKIFFKEPSKIGQVEFRQCMHSNGYTFTQFQVKELFAEHATDDLMDATHLGSLIFNSRRDKGLRKIGSPTKESEPGETTSRKKMFHPKEKIDDRGQRKHMDYSCESPLPGKQNRKHFSPEEINDANGRRHTSPGKRRIAGKEMNYSNHQKNHPLTQQPGGNASIKLGSKPQEVQEAVPRRRQYTHPAGYSLSNNIRPEQQTSIANRKKLIHSQTTYDKDPPIRSQRARGPRSSPGQRQTPVKKGAMRNPGGESTFQIGFDSYGATPNQDQSRRTQQKPEVSLILQISNAINGNGRIREVFRKLNVSCNRKGVLKKEFREGMGRLGVSMDEDQTDDLYAKNDRDLDDILSYSDFVRMIASIKKN